MKVLCFELDALLQAAAKGQELSRAKEALLASTADELVACLTDKITNVRNQTLWSCYCLKSAWCKQAPVWYGVLAKPSVLVSQLLLPVLSSVSDHS